MKILSLFTCTYLLFVSTIYSQERDTVRNLERELLSRPDSDAMLLAKSRDALREAILASDRARITELAVYIRTRFDTTDIVALWPREWLLVHYWTGDYRRLLAESGNEERYISYRTKLTPPDDLFIEHVLRHTGRSLSDLESRIRSTQLDPEDQDFLVLFLHYIVGPREGQGETADAFRIRMNGEADEVLLMHRNSRHNPFIRKHIRWVFVPSLWGGGLAFSIGPGTLSPNLVLHFTDPLMIEITFDGAYRSFFGSIGLNVGAASPVHTSFTDTEGKMWQKDLKVNHFLASLVGGILVEKVGPVDLAPFAGLGYVDISPPEQERRIAGNDVSLGGAAVVLGLNIDIPVARSESFFGEYDEDGHWLIRVKPMWHRTLTDDPFLKGSMFSVTIGVGIFARPMERDL